MLKNKWAELKREFCVVINKLKTGIMLDVINEPGKINWPVLYCLVKVRSVKQFALLSENSNRVLSFSTTRLRLGQKMRHVRIYIKKRKAFLVENFFKVKNVLTTTER